MIKADKQLGNPKPPPSSSPISSQFRLLYADDDPDTRDMICLALQVECFEVVCPATLQDFLKVAKADQWDLYMLDTWMPEISGFELWERIREFDSKTPNRLLFRLCLRPE